MPQFNFIGPRLLSASGKSVSPYVRIMADAFVEVANTHRGLLTFNEQVHPNSRARCLTTTSSNAMRLIALKTWRQCRDCGLRMAKREGFVTLCQEKFGGGNDDDVADVMAEAHRRFIVLEGGE